MVLFKIQSHRPLALAALGLVWATAVCAQPIITPPLAAPIAGTKSAFAGYKAFTDEPVSNWKAANETVAKVGGWREYARQAQQPDPAPTATRPMAEVKP